MSIFNGLHYILRYVLAVRKEKNVIPSILMNKWIFSIVPLFDR